jgi:hypothetical protein
VPTGFPLSFDKELGIFEVNLLELFLLLPEFYFLLWLLGTTSVQIPPIWPCT